MSRPLDADVLLRAEIPELKRFAEVILEGREKAAACGWYYNHSAHYSEDLVLAMAQRIRQMAEVIEQRNPLAPPGSRTDKMHRGARAAIEVLADGARHPASELRDAISRTIGIDSPQVATYVKHANRYLLDRGQKIAIGAGGRSYLMPTDEGRDDG